MQTKSPIRVLALVAFAIASISSFAQEPGPGEVFSMHQAAGRPSMRDQAGIFVWHEGNTFYVVSQSEHRKTTYVRAVLRDGKIINVSRIHDERGDTISQPRDNVVIFRSRTFDGRDEMRFDVVNGRAITFEIREPNERQRPIYIGGTEIRAHSHTITIRGDRR